MKIEFSNVWNDENTNQKFEKEFHMKQSVQMLRKFQSTYFEVQLV